MFDPIINGKLNRLLEGGGYSETEKKVLLPETAVDFVDGIYLLDFVPVADTMYTVTLNGEQYKVKSVGVDVGGGVLLVFVGNLNMMLPDFPATSEPFVIAYAPDSAATVLTHKDGDIGTITISISEETETIHPIDPKYLPGVCLPVVEISGDIDVENMRIPCTAAESVVLDAAAESCMPVVLKISALVISAVAAFTDGGYIFSFNGITISCTSSDKGWLVILEQN
jgi:hypothetical protein